MVTDQLLVNHQEVGSNPTLPTMIYMGFTKSQGKRHLIEVDTGFETKALCGATITRFVCKYGTNDPVPYSIHWERNSISAMADCCDHCDRLVRGKKI